MEQSKRIMIPGGQGKVAVPEAARLRPTGRAVDSVIRNRDQRRNMGRIGSHPELTDMESATVFSAGGRVNSPERPRRRHTQLGRRPDRPA